MKEWNEVKPIILLLYIFYTLFQFMFALIINIDFLTIVIIIVNFIVGLCMVRYDYYKRDDT